MIINTFQWGKCFSDSHKNTQTGVGPLERIVSIFSKLESSLFMIFKFAWVLLVCNFLLSFFYVQCLVFACLFGFIAVLGGLILFSSFYLTVFFLFMICLSWWFWCTVFKAVFNRSAIFNHPTYFYQFYLPIKHKWSFIHIAWILAITFLWFLKKVTKASRLAKNGPLLKTASCNYTWSNLN